MRPRQGTKNDCRNAGEGYRRTDRLLSLKSWWKRESVFIAPRARPKPSWPAWVPPPAIDITKFEILPGVLHVHRISSPYKLAGRGFRPEGTVVEFANGVKLGGEQVVVMAGPCSIENASQIFETAERVKAAGASFLRGGAYKPRSSPYAFQGMGIPGLKLMRDAADAHGLLVVSEVMEISQIESMLPYVDCFQVGARNMQNFNLLRELRHRCASRFCSSAESPPLLKNCCFRANTSCPAATTTSFSANAVFAPMKRRRATQWISRPSRCVKKFSHLPIVGDPSHGTGRREMVAPMAAPPSLPVPTRIIVEVHPNADKAASDAAQTLYPDQFEKLMAELRVIAKAVGRTL